MRLKIREIREKKGMDLKALGDAAFVDPRSIYRYEKGKHWPGLYIAALIARAMGVTIDELIDWEEDGHS